MTSPAVAPDISSCHQAAILTAASRLVAGLSPRAPELSSRPVHARLLWTARHRNRFFSELHFHLVSVTPLLLHAHSSVPPHAAQPNNMCERRSVLRDAGWRFEVFWSVCVCVCVCVYTHTHTLLSGGMPHMYLCPSPIWSCIVFSDMPHMYLCPSPVWPCIVFSQLKCHKSISSDKFIGFWKYWCLCFAVVTGVFSGSVGCTAWYNRIWKGQAVKKLFLPAVRNYCDCNWR